MTATANPDSFAYLSTDDLCAILDRIEAVLLARQAAFLPQLSLVPEPTGPTAGTGAAA